MRPRIPAGAVWKRVEMVGSRAQRARGDSRGGVGRPARGLTRERLALSLPGGGRGTREEGAGAALSLHPSAAIAPKGVEGGMSEVGKGGVGSLLTMVWGGGVPKWGCGLGQVVGERSAVALSGGVLTIGGCRVLRAWGKGPLMGLGWSCRLGDGWLEVSWALKLVGPDLRVGWIGGEGSAVGGLQADVGGVWGTAQDDPGASGSNDSGLGALRILTNARATSEAGLDWNGAVVGGAAAACSRPVRSSRRISRRASSLVVEAAIARKAWLQDSSGSGHSSRSRAFRRKARDTGAKCGVRLCEAEVDMFVDYVSLSG